MEVLQAQAMILGSTLHGRLPKLGLGLLPTQLKTLCDLIPYLSSGQALTLLSEDCPNSVSCALSEILAKSLGVQDLACQPSYYCTLLFELILKSGDWRGG